MFDVAVIVIMSISVMMALFRGFVKEFFTIVSWVIATILTIYLSPVVQSFFPVAEGKKAFYDAISVLIVFSISMILLSFIFGKVMSVMKKSNGMFLDRSLGVLFGLVRGALLICLGYIFIVGFMYEEKPEWVQGKTVKLVEIGANQLMKLNPKEMNIDISKNLVNEDTSDKIKGVKAIFDPNTYLKEDLNVEDGYPDEVRDKMKDLIDNDILQ